MLDSSVFASTEVHCEDRASYRTLPFGDVVRTPIPRVGTGSLECEICEGLSDAKKPGKLEVSTVWVDSSGGETIGLLN